MSNEQTTTESNESTDTEVQSTIAHDTGEQNEVEQDQVQRPDWLPEKFETPEHLMRTWKESFIHVVMRLKKNLFKN